MGVSEPLIQTSLLGEAIENGPVAVLVADEHGRYVAVNQDQNGTTTYTVSKDQLVIERNGKKSTEQAVHP